MQYSNEINIQITNKCNLNCNFCMNSNIEFDDEDYVMSTPNFVQIVAKLVNKILPNFV